MAVLLETKNGRNSNTAAQPITCSRFITLPSGQIWMLESDASSGPSLHRQAIHTLLARARYARDEIESLYMSLARIAAQAHALKDVEAVELASQIMIALPVSSRSKNVARYYQACCVKRKGDFEAARKRLDRLLDEDLDPRSRSLALLTKGGTYLDSGQIDEALPFYVEAGRMARDCELAALVQSFRQIAIIKGMHGDHHEAISDLESLVPTVSRIFGSKSIHGRLTYCEVLNSYAVELGEVGRVEQALSVVSTIAPFASIYPEFSETIAQLQRKLPTRKRSVVVIHSSTKLEPEPQADPDSDSAKRHSLPLACVTREGEWRFTNNRALRPASVRFTVFPTITVLNPARAPTKPRAP